LEMQQKYSKPLIDLYFQFLPFTNNKLLSPPY
jgi:hypothetical protein